MTSRSYWKLSVIWQKFGSSERVEKFPILTFSVLYELVQQTRQRLLISVSMICVIDWSTLKRNLILLTTCCLILFCFQRTLKTLQVLKSKYGSQFECFGVDDNKYLKHELLKGKFIQSLKTQIFPQKLSNPEKRGISSINECW